MKEWVVVLDVSGHHRAMRLPGMCLLEGDKVLDWEPLEYIDACSRANGYNEVAEVMES